MDKLIKEIKVLQEPYTHLVIGKKEGFKNIFNKLIESDREKEKIFCSMIEGENCQKVDDLFEEFAVKLKFPNYFGKNWAAFDECLNDLEWLDSEKYVLFIKDFDKVLIEDGQGFKVFVNILISTINEWISGRDYDSFPTPPTPFHLVIHCNEENVGLLNSRFSKVNFSKLNKVIL
jgi:RNAse (barnase) inhibitor barstar